MSKRLVLLYGGLWLGLAVGLCSAQQPAPAKSGQQTNQDLSPELRIIPDMDPMPKLEVVTTRKTDGKPIPGLLVTTMMSYLLQGYGVNPNRVFGAPAWMTNEFWVINGKPSDELRAALDKMSPEEKNKTGQMERRSTLKDLFKMKAHIETRQLPYWELVPGKGGVKVKEVPPATPLAPGERPKFTPGGPPPPGLIMFGRRDGNLIMANGRAVTMKSVISLISGMTELDHRPIVDKTGFTGSFDIVDVQMGNFNTDNGGPGAPEMTSVSTILQENFNLKLVTAKGPVEVVVIDSIEEAEN